MIGLIIHLHLKLLYMEVGCDFSVHIKKVNYIHMIVRSSCGKRKKCLNLKKKKTRIPIYYYSCFIIFYGLDYFFLPTFFFLPSLLSFSKMFHAATQVRSVLKSTIKITHQYKMDPFCAFTLVFFFNPGPTSIHQQRQAFVFSLSPPLSPPLSLPLPHSSFFNGDIKARPSDKTKGEIKKRKKKR